MKIGLTLVFGVLGLTLCQAAVDPCSEQYPHLGTDFVTSQSKVENH